MALGQIQNYYANQDQMDAARLSRRQGNEALVRGEQAANLADPFRPERGQYQKQLSTLLSNPGQLDTSPFYKYLQSTQMEAVKASNAARGFTNSGRGLMALQDRAAGVASQAYFPQAHLLSTLAGATTGSPATAGQVYARGSERSQDYGTQSLAQRNYQPPPGPAQKPWYDTPFFNNSDPMFGGKSTGLPSGGYQSSGYSDYYAPSYANANQLPADGSWLTPTDNTDELYPGYSEDYGYDNYYGQE
jgi:hypothetical protein